jgi:hypothetical protein
VDRDPALSVLGYLHASLRGLGKRQIQKRSAGKALTYHVNELATCLIKRRGEWPLLSPVETILSTVEDEIIARPKFLNFRYERVHRDWVGGNASNRNQVLTVHAPDFVGKERLLHDTTPLLLFGANASSSGSCRGDAALTEP